MRSVPFNKETDDLVAGFAQYCGQGIHGGFRLHCEHTEGMQVYDLIPRLAEWGEVTKACGKVVVRYGLRHPEMEHTGGFHITKLGFLLARRSLQVLKQLMLKEAQAGKPGVAMELYRLIHSEIGFSSYRLAVEPLAASLLSRICTPAENCPDCRTRNRANRGKGRPCPRCQQKKCPMHCDCVSRPEEKPHA